MPISYLALARTAVAMALATLLPATSAQAEEQFAYKSAPLDTPVKRFVELNPEFACEPSAVGPSGNCVSRRSTYAGFDAKEIRASFLAGKLSHIEISVIEGQEEVAAKHAFNVIEQALTDKYGPSRSTGDKLENLVRVIRSWRRDGASIQLSHATNGTTHLTSVMIGRDDHWQRSLDLRNAKAKKDI